MRRRMKEGGRKSIYITIRGRVPPKLIRQKSVASRERERAFWRRIYVLLRGRVFFL